MDTLNQLPNGYQKQVYKYKYTRHLNLSDLNLTRYSNVLRHFVLSRQSNLSRFSCLTRHSSLSRNSTLSRNRRDTLVCSITNCLLQVVFSVACCQLPIAYCLLPITNCKLPMTKRPNNISISSQFSYELDSKELHSCFNHGL